MMFMSRWLSFGHLLLLSPIIFTLRSCVIPGLSGDLVIPDLLVIPGLTGDLFAASGCNTGRLLLRSPVRVNAP
jgi:hypothetical protein